MPNVSRCIQIGPKNMQIFGPGRKVQRSFRWLLFIVCSRLHQGEGQNVSSFVLGVAVRDDFRFVWVICCVCYYNTRNINMALREMLQVSTD